MAKKKSNTINRNEVKKTIRIVNPTNNTETFGFRSTKWALIAALVLFLPCIVQAQITTLTPLATYDAGENIVSYFEYLALDCPNEGACAYSTYQHAEPSCLVRHVIELSLTT